MDSCVECNESLVDYIVVHKYLVLWIVKGSEHLTFLKNLWYGLMFLMMTDFAEIVSENGMYFWSKAKMSEIVGMQLEKRLSLCFENYFTWSAHFPFVKQHWKKSTIVHTFKNTAFAKLDWPKLNMVFQMSVVFQLYLFTIFEIQPNVYVLMFYVIWKLVSKCTSNKVFAITKQT